MTQTIKRIRADLAARLPELNPTIAGSFVRAIVESVGIRINAANLLLEQVVKEAFPQTATGDNLERFAETITRNPASGATGDVALFGNALSVVPIDSALVSPEGLVYRTQATVTCAQQNVSISALSSAAGVATAVSNGHPLASGQELSISGANDAEYNGTFIITVVDENTFTYAVEGSPNSPTSGTIVGTFTGALVTVVSEDEGVATNQIDSAKLTLSTPIAGVNSQGIVRLDGITGGADAEDDASLRQRILQERSAIAANFSVDSIVLKARTVPGVTRVSVQRATPAAGDVTVLFVRDGDQNIIPSSADVALVRGELLEILPATSEPDALIVSAPTPIDVDFTFTAVTPNTQAMTDAINAQLKAFFDDDVEIGTVITEDSYRSAIAQTVAGDVPLQSFTLSAPSGNVAITSSQIGILGQVTFP